MKSFHDFPEFLCISADFSKNSGSFKVFPEIKKGEGGHRYVSMRLNPRPLTCRFFFLPHSVADICIERRTPMPSADMITRSVLSKRANHHHPFFNAICFLLHLQGFRPAVQEEHVLNGTGQRCDITISFQDGPLPSSGIFHTIYRHMILEFKSFHYPLDENAFFQISGYAETYALSLAGRKQVAPLLTLAVFGFTMMQWFQ
ncbi:MAG: hypothetical protein IKD69_02275, partial [Solobacterium sp.]|nr:hypothetical protein [Solobacterium sp.]